MGFMRQVWAIVKKDVATEVRTREMLSAMLVFALLTLLIFSFALDLHGRAARAAAPGVLWVTVVFAGTLGLSRSMIREQETGCIDGLLLAPIDRSAIFLAKVIGNLVAMITVEAVLLPLFSALFDVSLLRPAIVLVVVLGTAGYAAAGTLLAAMAVHTRAREVMLPVLLLPLVVPLLIGAVQATGGLVQGAGLAEINPWIRLLVSYDLVVGGVSMLTFGALVSE